jgi:hypothetical protein
MKKIILIPLFVFACFANTVFGQDIPQSQVPSVIVNNFQQTFPKAFDVEWKLKGDTYKVEFEIGPLGTDHDVWYDKIGKMVRHKEEISKNNLPQKVLAKLNSDFSGYRTDDIDKITEGNKVVYKIELKSWSKEWKVVFDNEGNILSKVTD